MSTIKVTVALVCFCVFALAGCGGSGYSSSSSTKPPPLSTQPPPPPVALTIAVAPTTRSVAAGASVTLAVTTAGGSGTVTLGLTGSALLVPGANPGDIGWSYAPASITAGGSSTLTLAVGANVPAGTYNLTLTASASGTQATTPFSLTVSSTSSAFTLAVSPTTQTLAAGTSATFAVNTIGGSGTVTLGLTGSALLVPGANPGDIGWSYAPASVPAGDASALTLDVGAAVPADTYNLTLTASTGSIQVTTPLILTVAPAASTAGIFWDDEMEAGNSGYVLPSNGAMSYDASIKVSGNESTRLNYPSDCYPDASAQVNCGGFMDRNFTQTANFYRRFYIRFSAGFQVSDVFTKLMRSDTTGPNSNWWVVGCCGSQQFLVSDQGVPAINSATNYYSNFTFQDAQWYCVETYEQLNTPGVANGIAEAWVDGVQILDVTNIPYRQAGDNSLFYNNRLYRQTGIGSIWYDRIAVGDQRIGCLAPSAANGDAWTTANTSVNGTLAATGAAPLVFAITGNPAHGTLTLTDSATGAFTYTPVSGYTGTDSFSFTASDFAGTSTSAVEMITVTTSPTPPVAANASVATTVGISVSGTLPASGAGPLVFAISGNPANGSVTLDNAATGAFTYTPNSGYSGTDSFSFTASNAAGASAPVTETVTVIASGG